MSKRVSFSLGIPKHGWLPVEFRYGDIHMYFGASDVLNDPAEELADVILCLRENRPAEVTFWLEPAAYFFGFSKCQNNIVLTISETDYWDGGAEKRRILHTIEENEREIIEPISEAIRLFWASSYENEQWPYPAVKSKLEKL